jgi:CRP-like cAMP-binding protein
MLLSQVEKLKTMTAVARLVDFIIDLAGPGTGAKSMSLPYEKQILAAQLGITPESFSRTLRQLRPYGVVIEKDKVTVADIAGLRRLRIQD